MCNVEIITNNHKRDLIYGYELQWHDNVNFDEVRSDYDWLNDDEFETAWFFIYRGQVYCTQDFMAVNNPVHNPSPPDWQQGWDGYLTDTFFSGVLVRYPEDCGGIDTEHIIVATFYSA